MCKTQRDSFVVAELWTSNHSRFKSHPTRVDLFFFWQLARLDTACVVNRTCVGGVVAAVTMLRLKKVERIVGMLRGFLSTRDVGCR